MVLVASWLPWLTTDTDGGGRASAIGGTAGSMTLPAGFGTGQLIVLLSSVLVVAAAMAARDLLPLPAALAALLVSCAIAALIWSYQHTFVTAGVHAGYGLYLGAVAAVAAIALSVWTVIAAVRARRVH